MTLISVLSLKNVSLRLKTLSFSLSLSCDIEPVLIKCCIMSLQVSSSTKEARRVNSSNGLLVLVIDPIPLVVTDPGLDDMINLEL